MASVSYKCNHCEPGFQACRTQAARYVNGIKIFHAYSATESFEGNFSVLWAKSRQRGLVWPTTARQSIPTRLIPVAREKIRPPAISTLEVGRAGISEAGSRWERQVKTRTLLKPKSAGPAREPQKRFGVLRVSVMLGAKPGAARRDRPPTSD
jgi:hypothetical protein